MNRALYEEKYTCRTCGKRVNGYIPKKGDGMALMLRPHKNKNTGQRCTDREGYPEPT